MGRHARIARLNEIIFMLLLHLIYFDWLLYRLIGFSAHLVEVTANKFEVPNNFPDVQVAARNPSSSSAGSAFHQATRDSAKILLSPGGADDQCTAGSVLPPGSRVLSSTSAVGNEASSRHSLTQGIQCRLENKELWSKFHELGTEMIITKSGR